MGCEGVFEGWCDVEMLVNVECRVEASIRSLYEVHVSSLDKMKNGMPRY